MEHAHQHHGHQLTEKDVKFYLSIFVVLSFLTLSQVLLYQYVHLSHLMNAVTQTIIAVTKVVLVAYYFMHLKDESAWLKFIACIPIFAVLYTVFITVETLVR